MADVGALSFDPNLAEPSLRADPYPIYDELRQQSPVLQQKETKTWLVTGYHECARILRDQETFGKGAAMTEPSDPYDAAPTMLGSDPPDHTRLRGIVTRVFSARTINALEPHIREVTVDLLAKWAPQTQFEAAEGLAVPLPVIVIAEMLGVEAGDWKSFKRWSDDSISSGSILAAMQDPEHMARLRESKLALRNYFIRVIEERRKEPRDDLISRLVQANEENVLSEPELVAFCNLLLLAGNETTTNLLTAAIVALAHFPEQRKRLVDDPELIPNAVEEILRFDGPVQTTFRTVTKDTELGGVTLPAGSRVAAMLAAANRDPSHFPDPNTLDVGRENAPAHLGFGGGIHFCIGSPQARIEGRIALQLLLDRSPEYVLVNADDLEYGPTFNLGGVRRLVLADGN